MASGDEPIAEGFAVPVASQATPLVPLSAGTGKWRSDLCFPFCFCFSCDQKPDDFAICCSVCCCHPITIGQIYERAVQKALLKRLPLLSCVSIAACLMPFSCSSFPNSLYFLPVLALLTILPLLACGLASGGHSCIQGFAAPPWLNVVMLAGGAISTLFAFLIICTVRGAIRRREGIKPECCTEIPLCEDCCCACLCNPCTQCMILRHEKLGCVGNNVYSILSPTAFPV